jgi:hypothetical protein
MIASSPQGAKGHFAQALCHDLAAVPRRCRWRAKMSDQGLEIARKNQMYERSIKVALADLIGYKNQSDSREFARLFHSWDF